MKKKDPSQSSAQLGNLLLRYKKILKPPQASVEKEAIVVIKEVCGLELQVGQISYTVATRTLYIKAPSLLRSELLMRRTGILEALRSRLGDDSYPTTIL
jgi:dienelactone hydrolase